MDGLPASRRCCCCTRCCCGSTSSGSCSGGEGSRAAPQPVCGASRSITSMRR
jgi:hypothetical protein